MTSEAERALLIDIAREAILARVHGHAAAARQHTGIASQCAAAFVSLHRAGALRGCIGHLETNLPLGTVIAQCAAAAATRDPRFPPVGPEELLAVDIELSILGPLEPVSNADDVSVGVHGLMVESGWRRGLLLPQVAVEWNWHARLFIEHTCRKAGLPRDAWPSGGATLWRFEAEVFGGRLEQAVSEAAE